MSTTRHSDESVSTAQDPPGSYFGTDAGGLEHYWQSGSRTMTVTDGETTRRFRVPASHPDNVGALVQWCIHTIVQHDGEFWQDVKLSPEREAVLTGEVHDDEFEAVLQEAMA